MKGHPEVPCSRDYNEPLRRQLLQERLRFLQIARVEALREPAVNRSKQFASLLWLTLVAPEARHAHCRSEFPGFGLLLTCDLERPLEIRLSFGGIRFGPLSLIDQFVGEHFRQQTVVRLRNRRLAERHDVI
jgi:hypothetical protein